MEKENSTSKNKKFILLASIIFVVLALLGVGGIFLIKHLTTPKHKVKLQTPSVSIDIINGNKFLIANNNTMASGYAFYFYDGNSPDDLFDYIEVKTQDKFYLDVSKIFIEPKDYYFYCKCLGNDKYVDSDASEVVKFTNMFQLLTPNLAINNTELSWTPVNNAESYEIFSNNTLIAKVNQTNFDISSYVFSKSQLTFNFSIRAIGGDNFFESVKSNVVTYTKLLTLAKVENLNFNAVNKTLSWDSVKNASSYLIMLGDGTTYSTSNTSFSFSGLITNVGTYTFKVKAVGTNNFKDGEFSDSVHYTQTQRLNKVTNLDFLRLNENQLGVLWNSDEKALTYNIRVNGEVINVALSNNGFTINIDPNVNQYVVEVVVNGYGYYEDSLTASLTINI